jgi:hypothetical protein
MPCPRCGAESRPDQKFCKSCGAALESAESAASAAPAPAEPAAQAMPEPAPLRPIPDGGLTMDEVVAWLEGAGYSAKVTIGSSSGRPHIDTTVQDTPVAVMFEVKDGRCAYLNFVAGFSANGKFDIAQINAWNYDNRWCTAYYDDVNDPWLAMCIALAPGGTYESLNDQFATWNRALGRFIAKFTPE